MSNRACRVFVQCLVYLGLALSCGLFAITSIQAHRLLVQQLGDPHGL